MAAPFVAKYFFEGSYGGWSEVWYPKGSSAAAALAIVDSNIPIRMACAPSIVRLIRAEVSDLTIRGDVQLSSIAPYSGAFGSVSAMMPPWDALLINLRNVDGLHRGRKFMRGLPGTLLSDGFFSPTTLWDTNFGSLQSDIVSNFQLVKKLTVGPPPTFDAKAITSCTYDRLVHRPAGRPFGLLVGRRMIR